jgi:hypothetical protein
LHVLSGFLTTAVGATRLTVSDVALPMRKESDTNFEEQYEYQTNRDFGDGSGLLPSAGGRAFGRGEI